MKLGVLADIHSGIRPLEACLRALLERGAEGFLLLGDYVSDLPHPEKTMETLRDLMRRYPCHAVRGNREESMLERQDGGCPSWRYDSGTGSMLYTADRLSQASLNWFRSLPITRRVELDGMPPLRLCHGSPGHVRGILREEDGSAAAELERLEESWLLGGHHHRQLLLSHTGKTCLNPGPVRMGNKAQCALLIGENGRWQAELLTLDYDAPAYAREIAESGFLEAAPVYARGILYEIVTGEEISVPLIRLAFQYQHQLQPQTPEETESCWQRAGRELGVMEIEKRI